MSDKLLPFVTYPENGKTATRAVGETRRWIGGGNLPTESYFDSRIDSWRCIEIKKANINIGVVFYSGGWGEIRTHERLATSPVFKFEAYYRKNKAIEAACLRAEYSAIRFECRCIHGSVQ